MSFDPENVQPPGAKIKVIGVGGGGGNAVNTMIRSSLDGVDFITANTDVQALRFSLASQKLQVGKELTRGLGAGADPDIGRDAALEDRHDIQQALAGADMVFITAGMGGGTGTGGAAVVAQIARELGALTVAVVTKPFGFEGKRRRKHAELGIARLRECVDTLITIPNQRLLQVASPSLSMIDAFKMADDVLVNAVRGISDIINVPGTVNVDFADVKTVMSCMGQALMGIGVGRGDGRASDAARMAICSPLLEDIDIEGATGILINITAGSGLMLMEVNEACSIVQEAAHEDAEIIFGAVIDESLGDEMRVTVIATGFPVDKDELEVLTPSKIVKPQSVGHGLASRLTTHHAMARRDAAPLGTNSHVTPAAAAAKLEHQEHKAEAPPAPRPSPTLAAPPPLAASEPGQEAAAKPAAAEPASSSPPSFQDEAQELARWTLDHEATVGDLNSGAAAFLHAQEPAVFEEELTADLYVGSHHGGEALNGALAASDDVPLESEGDFLLATQEPAVLRLPNAPDQRPGAVAESSPFDSLFETSAGLLATDIDRKIDEALDLAERMRLPRISAAEDDLDVPAFLRSGMKDLPLE